MLGITSLTRRANGSRHRRTGGVPPTMPIGLPAKLVRAGQRVTICEQLEAKAGAGAGQARRHRTGSPRSIVLGDNILANKERLPRFRSRWPADDRWRSSTFRRASSTWPKAQTTTSTSSFRTSHPKEIIYQRGYLSNYPPLSGQASAGSTDRSSRRRSTVKNSAAVRPRRKGFGVDRSCGYPPPLIIYCLEFTEHRDIIYRSISRIGQDDCVAGSTDSRPQPQAVLVGQGARSAASPMSSATRTPMGGRLLKRWIASAPVRGYRYPDQRTAGRSRAFRRKDTDLWPTPCASELALVKHGAYRVARIAAAR